MSNREANYVEVQDTIGKGFKARRWCFTWNNYKKSDAEGLINITADRCDYIIFGYEIAPTTGMKHLQGYIEFSVPLAFTTVKSRLDPVKKTKSEVHVKAAGGTREDSYVYINKLETKDPDYMNEHGLPIIHEISFVEKKQGHRSDWDEIYNFLVNNPDFDEFAAKYPGTAIKYHGGIERIIRGIKNKNLLENVKSQYMNAKLKNWQKELYEEVTKRPHDRKIIWYYDEIGNSGKTWMSKLLYVQCGAAYFTNSKTADIAYAYNGEPIVVFDFSRSNEEQINYGVIETIKNGMLFSNKYESRTKVFNIPHVVVMANFRPNMSKMSLDRWDIRIPEKNEMSENDATMV